MAQLRTWFESVGAEKDGTVSRAQVEQLLRTAQEGVVSSGARELTRARYSFTEFSAIFGAM